MAPNQSFNTQCYEDDGLVHIANRVYESVWSAEDTACLWCGPQVTGVQTEETGTCIRCIVAVDNHLSESGRTA